MNILIITAVKYALFKYYVPAVVKSAIRSSFQRLSRLDNSVKIQKHLKVNESLFFY